MGNKIQRKRQQDRRRAHANRSSSPPYFTFADDERRSPYGTFVVDGLGEPVTIPAIGVDDFSGFKPQALDEVLVLQHEQVAALTLRADKASKRLKTMRDALSPESDD